VTKPRLLFAVQIAAVAGIVACLLALAARAPLRLDLTPGKQFSLSAHTRNVVARLDRPATITYFYSSQDAVIRRNAAELLALYDDLSPRLSVRLVDLDRNPGLAERYDVSSYNVAVVDDGEQRLRLDLVNEEIVTAALLRLIDRNPVPTYVIEGHGELRPDGDERRGIDQALTALAREGFAPHPLPGAAEIPADAKLIILAGPTHDLSDAETAALDAWVHAGGALLALVEAPTPPRVARLLGRFGIVPGDDVVVDGRGRLLGTDGLSAHVPYVNQALVPSVPDVAALLPTAQTVRLTDVPGVESDYLAVTAETAWADADRSAVTRDGPAEPGPDDHRGPLPVAVAATVANPAGPAGHVVFVGDADFVDNLHLDVLGNRELFLAFASLAANKPTTFAERPTSEPPSPLSAFVVTTTQVRTLLVVGSILPAVLLLAGAVVAHRRRHA
jgi:ABC-type uncharacterized transport system involved in gliding motility auxiliary subunit